uniref:ELM2 domain-containing protein n=1 Tax=Steinernema glaseri TaxID=37863 RepID=A0A1I7Y916_9BILA
WIDKDEAIYQEGNDTYMDMIYDDDNAMMGDKDDVTDEESKDILDWKDVSDVYMDRKDDKDIMSKNAAMVKEEDGDDDATLDNGDDDAPIEEEDDDDVPTDRDDDVILDRYDDDVEEDDDDSPIEEEDKTFMDQDDDTALDRDDTAIRNEEQPVMDKIYTDYYETAKDIESTMDLLYIARPRLKQMIAKTEVHVRWKYTIDVFYIVKP